MCVFFFFSSRSRHTRCALWTGVHTCALPILANRPMASGMCLPHAVVREVALFVDEAEEERLAHRGGFLRAAEQFREIEHGPLAQRPDPVLARGLQIGRASCRESGCQDV